MAVYIGKKILYTAGCGAHTAAKYRLSSDGQLPVLPALFAYAPTLCFVTLFYHKHEKMSIDFLFFAKSIRTMQNPFFTFLCTFYKNPKKKKKIQFNYLQINLNVIQ